MMTMFRLVNLRSIGWWVFFLVLLAFSCGDSPKEQPQKPDFSSFVLSDSTVLKMPNSFAISGKKSINPLETKIYVHFLQGFSAPPLQEKFFLDSLSEKHVLAVYQVEYKSYNQNMAALMNTALTRQFFDIDEQFSCFSIDKVESMQYASKEWNALKFKYQLSPKTSTDCPKESTFVTIFYFNGHNRAFYFVEIGGNEGDLDGYLRLVLLGGMAHG